MRWLRRLVFSWTGAAVAIVVFSGALITLVLLEHQRMAQERETTSYLTGTNQWVASQVEFELLRFQRALDRYTFEAEAVDHDTLMLRFDILWSRIPTFLTGPEAEQARSLEGAVETVEGLRAALARVEADVQSLDPGDRAGRRAILAELAPFEEPLHDITRRLGSGQWRSELEQRQRALVERRRLLSVGILTVSVLLVLVSLLVIQRSYRLAKQERDARMAAVSADQAKTRFLANMSHELRTPLNAVIGFAQIIRDEKFGPLGQAAYRDRAQDILTSAQHLLSVLNDVLNLARIESDRMPLNETVCQPSDIVARCQGMVEPDAERRQVRLKTAIPDDLPALRADPRLLRQICLNLLSNAIKYGRAGGEVVVAWRAERGWLVMSVTDDGPGIPRERLESIMLPFYQGPSSGHDRPEGSGLGLSLAKRFAELHQGYLAISSEEGQGTTVTVGFPPERVVSGAQAAEAP